MKTKSKALIIGNGMSRQDFDIHSMREDYYTFGCNAIYRDFEPDILVALDEEIISEILDSEFPKDRFIIPPLDEQFEPAIFNPARPRNNAGMIAMSEAIRMGFRILHCIGMDFVIDDPAANMSNVYDGTDCYGPETRASYHDCINRCKYMNWFAATNPHILFRFMFKRPHKFRRDIINSPNVFFDIL